MTKTCTACHAKKEVSEFYKHPRGRYGVMSVCKICNTIAHRRWLLSKPEKGKQYSKTQEAKPHRRERNWKAHGVDLKYEDYIILLMRQDHRCAICYRSEEILKRRLCVDHDHLTGEVRGLLCIRCNQALSLVENPVLLKNAIKYLKKEMSK